MKIVQKTLLASSIAVALAPAVAMADTTLFGNFDINVAVESGNETAGAINDSPAGDNVIGVEGFLDLENGHAVTYHYASNIDLDGDTGSAFAGNYQSYVGYKADSFEVRLGNQDLPLRRVMDKADNFAGTHADANNVIFANTTANSSLMVLGGIASIKYALSLDTNNRDGENANAKDSHEDIRVGGMVDISITDNISVAAGFESLENANDAYGVSANVGLTDSAEFTLAYTQLLPDIDSDPDVAAAIVGGSFGLNDTVTLKAQYGILDLDLSSVDNPTYYAAGADFALSKNVTAYALYAGATDFAPSTSTTTSTVLGTVEADADGEGSVFAGGLKVSF